MNNDTPRIEKSRHWLTRRRVLAMAVASVLIVLFLVPMLGAPVWLKGKLQYHRLEGGMFELETENGRIYDLHRVEEHLDPKYYNNLVDNPDVQLYQVKVFGIDPPPQADFHMRGAIVNVWSIKIVESLENSTQSNE